MNQEPIRFHYPDLGSFDVISTEFLPVTPRHLSRALPMAARGERGLEPRLRVSESQRHTPTQKSIEGGGVSPQSNIQQR